METFSLLDDENLSNLRVGASTRQKYKTRLLRLDQLPRTRQDPLQRYIHQSLRKLRYIWIDSHKDSSKESRWLPSSQNTSLLADILSRVIFAIITAVFVTVPLTVLAHETRKSVQIGVVSGCVVAFACLVSVALRATNLEMMVVCAAYAAIISVFVSNSTGPQTV